MLTIIDRPVVAILMDVATAAFGGVIRDTFANQTSVIINREIYLTEVFAGAVTYVGGWWRSRSRHGPRQSSQVSSRSSCAQAPFSTDGRFPAIGPPGSK
ncbi:TRIC cation channel family protein [Breoghania sp.]|uniref:TRIC cation channel family protein n=1 Tax=Breoghania sp. TaxID=2065378 RepID=UPI00261C97BA|nr:TRIC cation channel family protein [Breoghania sp.]MDJ0931019.1 TRIC cation channel family protein [Breoghania sp.]